MRGTGRLIGVDLGAKRIGVAVSDPNRVLALPVTTLERGARRAEDHQAVARLVEDYSAVGVVVGLPVSLDGREREAARQVRAEVEELAGALGVEVATWDERLSTAMAARALREGGTTTRRQRAIVDQAAAAAILQGYLDRHRATAAAPDGEPAE